MAKNNANLKADAAAKILNGGVSDETLKTILNLTNESPDIVIRTIDILADGRVKDHVTMRKEVTQFVARCSDYDQLLEEIEKEKERYDKMKVKAENARRGKETKNASKDD